MTTENPAHHFTTLSPSKGPLYEQVKTLIRGMIQKGHLLPDSKIPSENELVSRLKVSRMTIHRALRELTSEGVLVRSPGVGTFVAPPKSQPSFLEIKPISDEIRAMGGRYSCEVLLLAEESPSKDLAFFMGLGPDESIFHSILVHKNNGMAVQYAERFINPRIVPEYILQDFTIVTPSDYLLKVAPLSEAEHIIETHIPTREIKESLGMGEGEPCLVVHRTTWVNDTVATRNKFYHPGSRYRLSSRFKP